jgi:hypothetical protein
MTLALRDTREDHRGRALPRCIYAQVRRDTGDIVAFRVRWQQFDDQGRRLRPSRSFSIRRLGSADRALDAATFFHQGAVEASRVYRGRSRRPRTLTANDVFAEWMKTHAVELSVDYAEKMDRLWRTEIETRTIGGLRLKEISADPSLLVVGQDELVAEGLGASRRREIWKLMRAVLRWGRRRHPGDLTIEVAGLIELPRYDRSRLAYAADALGLERIIEAVLNRSTADDLLALRDAAFVAAMGFTVATRPSEWRLVATWESLLEDTVELQRRRGASSRRLAGLKRGAHVALLLPNARDRLLAYRTALEERFGQQPPDALVFQVLDHDGPVWARPGGGGRKVPLAWTTNTYNQWVHRVWAPARAIAARSPDSPPGLAAMKFYDCRHTAISMALHSTLVMGPLGMNLHPLAAMAGHSIQTLEGYYRHIIVRYVGKPPIDLWEECARARTTVEETPRLVKGLVKN